MSNKDNNHNNINTNSGNFRLPSIFTPRDSLVVKQDQPPALLRGGSSFKSSAAAASPSESSSGRRQSTPDWLERGAIRAAAVGTEAGEVLVVTEGVGIRSVREISEEGLNLEKSGGASGAGASSNNKGLAWAVGAATSDRTDNSESRGRSTSVSQVASAVGTPPAELPPPLPPAVNKTPGSAEAAKRKRDVPVVTTRQAPTSEPVAKRPRFAKTKHTLDGFTFGPVFNPPALQPQSPLFFSNSPRPRPTLPPRFSSSEAAAKMLSKARTEDSHVKTVSLPRGSIAGTPGFPSAGAPRSGSELSVQRSLDWRSGSGGRSSSPDVGGSSGEIGLLSSIGVIELLEQDERPTFIVDLAESGNYGPGQLHTLFANSSLRSYTGMLELVNGAASEEASPGPRSYLQFKSWMLSAAIDGESLNVCLPSFKFAGMTWSCSTLRKRLRIISAAVIAGSPVSPGHIRASVPRSMIAEPVSGSMHTGEPAQEPADYFAGALPPSTAPAEEPRSPGGKTDVIPTIEDTAPLPNGTLAPPHLSDPMNLTSPSQMYARDSPSRGRRAHGIEGIGSGANGTGSLLRRTPTTDTADSRPSHIDLAPSDAPCFDWTRLPVSPSMPSHIQFARSVDWAATALGPIEF
ncbi:hypothetical protein LTR91_024108, partial [Friedmanniomyces endolithicus]